MTVAARPAAQPGTHPSGTTAVKRAAQLADYLLAARGAPFSWAAANCCHFAAGWVLFATGRSPMAGLPATPTAREALRLVQQLGGSLRAAWSRQLGAEPIPAAMAQVGDVVLIPAPIVPGETELRTGELVGICAGMSAIVATAEGHHAHVPMSMAAAAWRLPA